MGVCEMAAKVKTAMSMQARIERAQARAMAAGLQIVERGWCVTDGALAWSVASQSQPGRCYHVELVADQLTCECVGAHDFASVCIHQGAVYNEIATEAHAFAATQR